MFTFEIKNTHDGIGFHLDLFGVLLQMMPITWQQNKGMMQESKSKTTLFGKWCVSSNSKESKRFQVVISNQI